MQESLRTELSYRVRRVPLLPSAKLRYLQQVQYSRECPDAPLRYELGSILVRYIVLDMDYPRAVLVYIDSGCAYPYYLIVWSRGARLHHQQGPPLHPYRARTKGIVRFSTFSRCCNHVSLSTSLVWVFYAQRQDMSVFQLRYTSGGGQGNAGESRSSSEIALVLRRVRWRLESNAIAEVRAVFRL